MRALVNTFLGLSIYLSAAAISEARTTYKVHFLPVTFALECDGSTQESNRKVYPRALDSRGGVQERECVDAGRQLTGIKPERIAMEYDKQFDTFSVNIYLTDIDAKALALMTKDVAKNGKGKRLLVGVGGNITAAGMLYEPFSGDRFSLSTTSPEDGKEIERMFVEKSGVIP